MSCKTNIKISTRKEKSAKQPIHGSHVDIVQPPNARRSTNWLYISIHTSRMEASKRQFEWRSDSNLEWREKSIDIYTFLLIQILNHCIMVYGWTVQVLVENETDRIDISPAYMQSCSLGISIWNFRGKWGEIISWEIWFSCDENPILFQNFR